MKLMMSSGEKLLFPLFLHQVTKRVAVCLFFFLVVGVVASPRREEASTERELERAPSAVRRLENGNVFEFDASL